MYFDYEKKSSDIKITINENCEIFITKNNLNYSYQKEDIQILHFVNDFYNVEADLNNFNYINFIFKDGNNHLITSLMYKNLIEIIQLFDGCKMKFINRYPVDINLKLDSNSSDFYKEQYIRLNKSYNNE